MSSKRILSGIRPTGQLHLGNYLGAVSQFLEQQEDPQNDCFFFVADLHALTTSQKPMSLRTQSLEIVRSYLACGLDPNKSTLYKQSHIPEIPYLATLLSMITSESWLRKCTTFKYKAEKQEIISIGLLSYPVLMAADILIVNSDIVPVGHDQLQHLEMIRDIAQKFNHLFGEVFTLPEPSKASNIRVPGLDGSGKMGKSEGNTIGLFEEPNSIKKKVMSAVTDAGPQEGQEMSQEMKNIYKVMELCSPPETYQQYLDMYHRGEQKFYGELKKHLFQDINDLLTPLREKYNSSACSVKFAEEVLQEGQKKVRPIAQEVLSRVFSQFRL